MSVSRDRIVLIWSVLLAVLVLAPLGLRGYVLSYDMVWVPDPDLARPDVWGLGTALPRAVPSDAWVAVLGSVLPAWLVQRVVLLVVLVVGAVGAARLVRDLPVGAALVAATFWSWNPFVFERLLIGHWPLLLGYAALPWLIAALRRDVVPWGTVVLCGVALGLTPVGGLLAAVTVLVVARRRLVPLALTVLGSAPWIVAGLLHADAARTDRAGVGLFDLASEGPLGSAWTALTMGGIWNSLVAPGSRDSWLSAGLSLVLLAVALVGARRLARSDRDLLVRLSVLALVGLVVAGAGRVVPGLLEALQEVPGGGLLRDGTRWLLLLAPWWAVTLAHGAAALVSRVADAGSRGIALALCVALPVVALPDLAWGLGGRIDAVDYPTSWQQTRADVATSEVRGDLLVLPYSSYRAPAWNGGRSVLDPAGRYFPRTTVVSDELRVSGRVVSGEDPRAAEVGSAVADRDVDALRDLGIGLVVTDASAEPATEPLGELVSTHGTLTLSTLGDAEPYASSTIDRVTMTAVWLVYLATVLAGLVLVVRGAVGGRRGAAGGAGRT